MAKITKYPLELIARAEAMREAGNTWTEIGKVLERSAPRLKNAVYNRTGPKGTAYTQDAMPRQVRPWPKVDFSPDELQVEG